MPSVGFYRLIGDGFDHLGTAAYTEFGSLSPAAQAPRVCLPAVLHNGLTLSSPCLCRCVSPLRCRVFGCSRSSGSPPVKSFFSLGSSRQLSRRHLALQYSPALDCWQCVVMGKNAVLVDGRPYKKSLQGSGLHAAASAAAAGTAASDDSGAPDIVVRLPADRCTAIRVGDVKCWFCPARSSSRDSTGGERR